MSASHSNHLNTDTRGTKQSVYITEVSVTFKTPYTDTKVTKSGVHMTEVSVLLSHLLSTDTKGTELRVRITEVSVLWKLYEVCNRN